VNADVCGATVSLAIICISLMKIGYNLIDEKINAVCIM
jgi:hypothetical protein